NRSDVLNLNACEYCECNCYGLNKISFNVPTPVFPDILNGVVENVDDCQNLFNVSINIFLNFRARE
ncbi:unnamed protein product, partial [Rotaria sp. Silwood2]